MWRSAVDDSPVDDAELAEDALEQVRDARLAVGPGGCEQERQVVVAAGAVDPRRQLAEKTAGVIDDDDRQPAGGGAVGPVGIRHDGDGALLGGGRRELGAVPVHAPDGDEHVTRAQVGRRERQPGERHAGGVAADVDAESGGEIVERMGGGRVRAEHGGQVRGRVGRHGASILSSAPWRIRFESRPTQSRRAGTVAMWK